MNNANVVDLFCGVGGFSLGFQQAGFDIKLGVDDHQTTLDTYSENFTDTTVANLDLSKVDSQNLLSDVNMTTADIDVVIGGPPCQGFSVMGNRDPDDDRNSLLVQFGHHIISLQPEYFVVENVKGLLSDLGKDYLNDFMQIVTEDDYNIVQPIKTLDAVKYGVPQNRERVIILGYRSENEVPSYPEPQDQKSSVSDAIGDIPDDLRSVEISNGEYRGELGDKSNYVEKINAWGHTTETKDSLSGLDPVNHSKDVRECSVE